ADGYERNGIEKPRHCHVAWQVWQMTEIQQRNCNEHDVGDRNDPGFGRSKLTGQYAAHDDDGDHQRHGGFLGRSRKLAQRRSLAFETDRPKEMAVHHQSDTNEESWYDAA